MPVASPDSKGLPGVLTILFDVDSDGLARGFGSGGFAAVIALINQRVHGMMMILHDNLE
jgi:hypothetical protein